METLDTNVMDTDNMGNDVTNKTALMLIGFLRPLIK
jgi:hypothetical protein